MRSDLFYIIKVREDQYQLRENVYHSVLCTGDSLEDILHKLYNFIINHYGDKNIGSLVESEKEKERRLIQYKEEGDKYRAEINEVYEKALKYIKDSALYSGGKSKKSGKVKLKKEGGKQKIKKKAKSNTKNNNNNFNIVMRNVIDINTLPLIRL